MRLLDPTQAQYFCRPSPAVVAAVGAQSLKRLHVSLPSNVVLLREGQNHFHAHQINSLHWISQALLYATVSYRRALDMLVPASAPWAQVTLYYASFFAAQAILGMFGGWVGQTKGPRFVDVENGVPGAQALRIYRKLASPNGASGSHLIFWDFFYDATAQLAPWAPAPLASALQPVNGDFRWQIEERNKINYDMFEAWGASKTFFGTFNPARLNSLRGPLQLQFDASERMIKLALHFADAFGLETGSLTNCGWTGTSAQIRRRLGSKPAPALVNQSAFKDF